MFRSPSRSLFPALLAPLLLTAALLLSGCDSAEERAEKHFQAGMELLQEGDIDRALVEFRNVFQLNGTHREARATYAQVQRERGELADAYSQYLLLAEQFPEDGSARLALAEMAIERGDWPEAERHGREAGRLLPADPLAEVIGAALDYRAAALARDRAATDAPTARARDLLAAHPGNIGLAKIARRILIDHTLTGGNPASALPEIEAALALDPAQLEWQMLKLRLLLDAKGGAGGQEAIAAHLTAMFEIFPDNLQVRNLLIASYMERKDLDGAEAFLRRLAEEAAAGTEPDAAAQATRARLTVVQFLQQARGPEAARAEVERLVLAEPENRAFRATLAALDFEAGRRDEAIAALETLVQGAEETEETHNIKVALARMLRDTGNAVGARARIEEVLAADPGHVEALKMQAVWLTEEDKPGDAILALRTALDQAPRDAEVLTLMGRAHERDGARDLAGERYGMAVEVSGRAPAESLLYAQFLIADDRLEAAQTVLDDALQVSPRNARLLAERADLLIRLRQWDSADLAVADLRALGTPAAIAAANRLDTTLLLQQEKIDETIAFLQSLSGGADANRAAVASVVQTQVRAGQLAAARDYLDELLAKTPEDPTLRFLRAGLHVLEDDPGQAEAIYRALMAEEPANPRPLQALYKLLQANGRADEAKALLESAVAAEPDSTALQMMQAVALERAGDFDGAIAIYEVLYAKDTNNLILANNLASMITTHRSDPESVERAFAIARRLKGADVPAFQDTYGWIEYRRGNFEEALASLEPAAAALPQEALVQLHLGMTYAALDRPEEARATLTRALEIAGDSPLPAFEEARKVLQTLPAAP